MKIVHVYTKPCRLQKGCDYDRINMKSNFKEDVFMKKLIALLCCLMALAMLFSSCNKNEKKPDDTTADSQATGVDTSDLYDEDGYLKDSIPDSIDYGGALVRVVGWGDEDATQDFSTDVASGDTISAATFYRNEAVMERLNVEIEFDLNIMGNNANRYTYIATVEQNLRTGVQYDLIACYSMNAANFAADGYLIDLKSQSAVLDIEKPWWSSNMLEGSIVNDQLYFASGSISTTSIVQTMAMAVNMEKIDDRGLDDPRELALDGKWTMAKLYEMTSETYIDLNATTEGKDEGDSFGLVMQGQVCGDAFFASNGLNYLECDESGKLILSPGFKGEKNYNLMRDLIEKFKTNDFLYTSSMNNAPVFYEERALFMGTDFNTILRIRDRMDFEYGYLPYPKADEDQDEYYTCSGFPYTMWCIPTYCKDQERAAYVMEALASDSYRTIQPEIYDKIKYQGHDDPINAEMFDLIIVSKTYDMGRIFHNMFSEWRSAPVFLFRQRLFNYDNLDWYSALANQSATTQSVINKINASFGY